MKDYLDKKLEQYKQPAFIDHDPVQIPHCFKRKEDIEIAGFLTATISWGLRKTIINNAFRMMQLMDMKPFDFITQHQEKDLKIF